MMMLTMNSATGKSNSSEKESFSDFFYFPIELIKESISRTIKTVPKSETRIDFSDLGT